MLNTVSVYVWDIKKFLPCNLVTINQNNYTSKGILTFYHHSYLRLLYLFLLLFFLEFTTHLSKKAIL